MTTAPTPCEAERLARGLEGGGNGYFEWLKPAAAELRRLQAENERLRADIMEHYEKQLRDWRSR